MVEAGAVLLAAQEGAEVKSAAVSMAAADTMADRQVVPCRKGAAERNTTPEPEADNVRKAAEARRVWGKAPDREKDSLAAVRKT